MLSKLLIAFVGSLECAHCLTMPLTRRENVPPIAKVHHLLAEHRESEHALLTSGSIDVELNNLQNVAYTGPIYFTD